MIFSEKIKTAFDSIQADEALKYSTLHYIKNKIRKKNTIYKKLAVSFSVFTLLMSAFFYYLYFIPDIYVDMDINPSVEIIINRFDRVIGVYAYNQEGEEIISNLKLKHKNYNNAMSEIINEIEKKGYITDNSLFSVTLQTDNLNREQRLLSEIKNEIENIVFNYQYISIVEVFPVSEEIKNTAYENDLSPVKYLAIKELMEVDSEVTIESCREHSVYQIRQMTKECKNNHHNTDSAENGGTQNSARINHKKSCRNSHH